MTVSSRLLLVVASTTLLMGVGAIANAQSAQSLPAVQKAAESHVRTRLPQTHGQHHVTATALDSRLRLAACATALTAFMPNASTPSAKTTVGVRCIGSTPWTVYVPVTVEIEAPVLVLRRGLARRASVEPSDVELQTRRLPGIADNFVSDTGNLSGRRLKRALTAGTPLTTDVLVPDVLVQRGQQVTLLAAIGGIEIRAQGTAVTEGGANERIRVRNATSLKIVEGVVENAGTVRVDL